ncbi:unnamed protein product (macronuclear) [Paramecium tetraurelia]|uniref:Uncharacterized protein n=1 Tax=Paramecium tetraurelia TaxID=5888 RepID=A0BIZ0_PARTE|nr:uncharacterized protein GSPATT00004880001 [Paramecium tetraurelia]CAK58507.1 unnamed protein product [Paramecium tetraurelia]|eukprot:XP_001425905.1 hypothetical protein (macronuclear) [Paramecium tetraurelia strain d4-2]
MKQGEFQQSETTQNTQECTNFTNKNDSSQQLNFGDSQNLYTWDQQSDESFELVILSNQHPENEWIKKEQVIVVYLKQLGIQMKTDPLEKQEKFYKKPKRRFNKSSTMTFDTIPNNNEESDNKEDTQLCIRQMSIEMNSIKQRRTPNSTPQSSPLITKIQEKQVPLKQQKMSIFQKMKGQQQAFSSDEEEIKENMKRNQHQISNEYCDGKSDSSQNNIEQHYFQNLCE